MSCKKINTSVFNGSTLQPAFPGRPVLFLLSPYYFFLIIFCRCHFFDFFVPQIPKKGSIKTSIRRGSVVQKIRLCRSNSLMSDDCEIMD
jgi:hypothetical protein